MKQLRPYLFAGALAWALLPGCDRPAPSAGGPVVAPAPPAREISSAPVPGDRAPTGSGPGNPVGLQRLFDALPEDDRPRTADDGPRREQANAWLAQNADGEWVEVRRPVERVELERQPDGGYSALLFFNGRPHVRVHGVEWELVLRGPDQARIPLADIDEAAAGRLRGLRRADVTVRGRVHRIRFDWNPQTRLAHLWVDLTDASIEEPS